MLAPGMTVMRPPACTTSSRNSAAPASALSRAPRIAAHIERAMKRHPQRAGGGDQRAATRHVDMPFGIERTDDDAVAADRRAVADIALHRFEFEIAVDEITGTRPDEHVDRQVDALARHGNLRVRRRQAADFERCAQLDAVGATGLRGERRCRGIRRDLEQRRCDHRQYRLVADSKASCLRASQTA
jgi:hypothetical protein